MLYVFIYFICFISCILEFSFNRYIIRKIYFECIEKLLNIDII